LFHAATRKAGGSKGATLFRNIDNPNEVIVLLEWDSVDKARKFVQSEDLRQTMQKAGVAERPDIYFLDQVQRTPS
jgi:heme-degrading monooxygenase HmoA